MSGKIKVTLMKSIHGQLANIAASVRGLGLRKRHQTVTVADTRENRTGRPFRPAKLLSRFLGE